MDERKLIDSYTPAELRLVAAQKEFWTAVKRFNQAENELIQAEEHPARSDGLSSAIKKILMEVSRLVSCAYDYEVQERNAKEKR